RTVEELTVRRVTGTVARAVPAMFCVVPFYDASRMSTYRIYDKYFSIRIFIDPHLLTLIFQYLAFIVSDLGEAFDLFQPKTVFNKMFDDIDIFNQQITYSR